MRISRPAQLPPGPTLTATVGWLGTCPGELGGPRDTLLAQGRAIFLGMAKISRSRSCHKPLVSKIGDRSLIIDGVRAGPLFLKENVSVIS